MQSNSHKTSIKNDFIFVAVQNSKDFPTPEASIQSNLVLTVTYSNDSYTILFRLKCRTII